MSTYDKRVRIKWWQTFGQALLFICGVAAAATLVVWALLTAPDAKGDSTLLPTPPPPLPTYIVKDDGTRLSCGPNWRWCWENPQP